MKHMFVDKNLIQLFVFGFIPATFFINQYEQSAF
jgi:hypothetical protein